MIKFEKAIDIAKKELKDTGHVDAKLIFELNRDGVNGLALMPLNFSGQKDKEKVQEFLNKEFHSGTFKDVDRYCFVSEGWFAMPRNDLPNVRPGLRADRQQCLIIAEYNRSGEGRMFMQEFKNTPDGKIKFVGKGNISDDKTASKSRMNFYADLSEISQEWKEKDKELQEKFYKEMMKKVKKKAKPEYDKLKEEYEKTGIISESTIKSLMEKMDSIMKEEQSRIKRSLLEDTDAD